MSSPFLSIWLRSSGGPYLSGRMMGADTHIFDICYPTPLIPMINHSLTNKHLKLSHASLAGSYVIFTFLEHDSFQGRGYNYICRRTNRLTLDLGYPMMLCQVMRLAATVNSACTIRSITLIEAQIYSGFEVVYGPLNVIAHLPLA